jgi:hypothetical protein
VQLDAGALLLRASWHTYLDEFAAAVAAAHDACASEGGDDAAGAQSAHRGASRRRMRAATGRYAAAVAAGPAPLDDHTAAAGPEESSAGAVFNPWGGVAATAFEAKYGQAKQPCYELLLGDTTGLMRSGRGFKLPP